MNLKRYIVVIIVVIVIIGLVLFNMFMINPKVLTVVQKTLVSDKVSKDMDDLVVVFFSDLHYGTTIKNDEINYLSETINSFDPDIVLFGGDLLDDISTYNFSDGERDNFISALSSIDARFGKYAVLGNHDIGSSTIKDEVTTLLKDCDFEVLNNKNTKIYINDTYINIVGIESQVLGNPDVTSAYSNIDSSNFTISICHTPDIFDELDTTKTDLVFAGHSHGGQIYLPLINILYMPHGAQNYNKGEYHRDNTTLYVSNGVGTTYFDARLFSDSEIVVYKIKASAS